MPSRTFNPLEIATRPPTPTEVAAAKPSAAEIDRLLADTAKAWGVPAARWNKIAAAMNARKSC